MTKAQKVAAKLVGSLSNPSKMPCHGWSISASRCLTGSRLAKIPGTPCSYCYAKSNNYRRRNVQHAHELRYQALLRDDWVDNMCVLIGGDEPYFRWFDAGDLQGIWHLDKIVQVARRTPGTKHWLPTQEYGFVAQWRKEHGEFPDNLCVRLSARKMDGAPPSVYGLPTSVVVSNGSHTCHAREHGHKCNGAGPNGTDCRACWDKTVANVSYPRHGEEHLLQIETKLAV